MKIVRMLLVLLNFSGRSVTCPPNFSSKSLEDEAARDVLAHQKFSENCVTASTRALGARSPGSNPGSPTNLNFFQNQRRFVARKKPCPPALFQLRRVNISELNRKVGQIQIQFFGKANGGSSQFFPSMILFRKRCSQ